MPDDFWGDPRYVYIVRPLLILSGVQSALLFILGLALRRLHTRARLCALVYVTMSVARPVIAFVATVIWHRGLPEIQILLSVTLIFLVFPCFVTLTMFLPPIRTYFAELNATADETP
jgi:hypothetical protein